MKLTKAEKFQILELINRELPDWERQCKTYGVEFTYCKDLRNIKNKLEKDLYGHLLIKDLLDF